MNTNWNHIKEIAENIGDDLNAEDAWNRFEQKRKQKKRKFLFWLPVSALSIIVLSGLIYLIQFNSSIQDESYSSQEKPIALQNIDENEIELNLNNQSPFDLADSNNDENIIQKKNEIQARNDNDNQNENRYQHVISKNKLSDFEGNNTKDLSTNNSIKNPNTISSQTRKTNTITKGVEIQNVLNNTIFANDNTSVSNDIDKTIQIPSSSVTNDLIQNKNKPFLAEDVNRASPKINNIVKSDIVNREEIYFGLSSILSPLKNQEKILAIEDYISLAEKPVYQNNPFASSLAFQVRYIYGFANRNLEGDNPDFNNRRNNQENFKESNSIELLLTKELSPSFSISSGLSINQYRAKLLEVNQELIQNISFPDVLLERRSKGGIVEEIRGEFIGSQTIITERIRYQSYSDFSIPVYADLHFRLFSKTSLSLSAGASVSILNKSNGVTFNSVESQGIYQAVDLLNYKNNGLIQGLANIGINTEINDHFDILVGGQLRSDLNNRIKASENTSDKFNSYGFLFEIRKRF